MVLVQAASLNDIVEMVVYDVFNVQGNYTKTESDTRYPFKGNNSIIRLNGQTISNDLTIDSDENGMSAGPITQNATVTINGCLLYTSPSPRDATLSRMPSSA